MEGMDDRDQFCEKSLLEYVRKSTPPPFLLKTYMLVEDPATDEIISWNGEGTAFVVWQPAEFARDLLPTLFKHSNFSSFVRQLNTYGFRKVATSRWEFSNDMFGKGKKDLLCEIRRRKAWTTSKPHNKGGAQPPPPPQNHRQHQAQEAPNNNNINNKDQTSDEDQSQSQRSSSTSSSSEYSILVDENKRLKKENGFLSSELFSMKRKCKDLLDLVAVYATNADATTATNVPKEHDEGDDDDRPKLFGVRLEVQGGEMGRKRKFAPENVFVFQSCK